MMSVLLICLSWLCCLANEWLALAWELEIVLGGGDRDRGGNKGACVGHLSY